MLRVREIDWHLRGPDDKAAAELQLLTIPAGGRDPYSWVFPHLKSNYPDPLRRCGHYTLQPVVWLVDGAGDGAILSAGCVLPGVTAVLRLDTPRMAGLAPTSF